MVCSPSHRRSGHIHDLIVLFIHKHSQLDEQAAGWDEPLRAGQDLYGLYFRPYNSHIFEPAASLNYINKSIS